MIHVRPKITKKDFVSARVYHRAKIDVNTAIGQEWHARMLPHHFQPGMGAKYGHKPRSPAYLKRKRRMFERRIKTKNGRYVQGGGQIDNLYSGVMREQLSRFSTVRAFPSRATVTMTGPRYVTMRVFDGPRAKAVAQGWTYGKQKKFSATAGQQPDKAKEITATTAEERTGLAEVADKVLGQKAAGW